MTNFLPKNILKKKKIGSRSIGRTGQDFSRKHQNYIKTTGHSVEIRGPYAQGPLLEHLNPEITLSLNIVKY